MDKKELLQKIANRALASFEPDDKDDDQEEKTTILPPNTDHLYVWRTDSAGQKIPEMDGVTVRTDWSELLEIIRDRHFRDQETVTAVVYPCAPIQCIDEP